ncbi:hypothetical protein KAS50_06030, partial [bacterium]|nr:hypothetical protein [bacterium]
MQGPAAVSASLKPPSHVKHSWDAAVIAVKVGGKSTRAVDSNPIDLGGKWYDVVTEGRSDEAIAEQVIDLTDKVKNGSLNWDAPEGEWRIIRFTCATIQKVGAHGAASAGKGSVDILNTDAVETYFDLMGNQLLKDAGPLAGKTLKYFYNVSWEGIYPNWTLGFEEEFSKYRGYAIKPYLPVLAGMLVENQEVSDRFILDFYHTLSDLFRNNCYRKIGELCHARGMQWHSENGGPWRREESLFSQADMLDFWGINDIPQAEFWVDKNRRPRSNARFASMAANLYGRPLVAIEAFTHMDHHWSKYPSYLKPYADKNFIDGANMFIWHTFTSSPKEVGKPGYEYFAGTHINPNITWWEEAGNFFDYLGRCQYLLRKGQYAADVLTYASDKNYVTWGRGEKWGDDKSLSLGSGYKYDLVNTEILVDKLSVVDGKLVLPGGMEYR